MKRTQRINLNRMRKTAQVFSVKPLALAVAAVSLVACGSTRDAKVYKEVAQCIKENPALAQECETAYQQALEQASVSGPKYDREVVCESEFGQDNCVPYRASSGQNWFMPAMAGFLFARAIDRNAYDSAPLFTSFSRYSPAYGRWTTVDGDLYGRRRYGSVTVGNDAFKPKPAVTRTLSRGGFGSKISAKSSWGGSASRGGWGG